MLPLDPTSRFLNQSSQDLASSLRFILRETGFHERRDADRVGGDLLHELASFLSAFRLHRP